MTCQGDWCGLPYVLGALVVALFLREYNATAGNLLLLLIVLILAMRLNQAKGWVTLPAKG